MTARSPWRGPPAEGARAESGALRFKVWRTWPYGQPGLDPSPAEAAHIAGRPGEMAIAGERLFAGCGEGLVQILSVQPDGRRIMSVAAFLCGYRTRLGERIAGAGGHGGAGECGPLIDHGAAGACEDPRGFAGEG